MIGGEPYTLGLFDTAGKIMLLPLKLIAVLIELSAVISVSRGKFNL